MIARSKLLGSTTLSLAVFSTAVFAKDVSNSEKGATFPPFDTTTFAPTLFWLLVTFATLYWLMSRVALPRISNIIENRNSIISRDIEQAAAFQKKAEDAASAYETALTKAKANALSIGADAKNEASKRSADRRKQVEADMATKIAAAEEGIASTKTAAMNNVSAIASEAVVAILYRLTGTEPDTDVVAKAVSANMSPL